MFEIEYIRNPVASKTNQQRSKENLTEAMKKPSTPEPGTKNILLKGQMKYIDDIDAIIYLCSPMLV